MAGTIENYAALCISILRCVDPDRAFEMLDDPKGRRRWTGEDVEEICRYRHEGAHEARNRFYGLWNIRRQ